MKKISQALLLAFVVICCVLTASDKARADTTSVFQGVLHTRLGNAQLTNNGDTTLLIYNLGSSGNDGVEIAMPDTATDFIVTMSFDTSVVIPDSAVLQHDHYARVNGINNTLLGSAFHSKIGANIFEFSINHSMVGATSETLKVYRHDTLIYSRTYTYGSMISTNSASALRGVTSFMLQNINLGFYYPVGPEGQLLPVGYSYRVTSTPDVTDPSGWTWTIVHDAHITGSGGIFVPDGTTDSLLFDHIESVSNALPGLDIQEPYNARFKATGIPIMEITNEDFTVGDAFKSSTYDGVLHTRLGDAILMNIDHGSPSLRLINLGSSGNDGVRIAMHDTATSLVISTSVDSTIVIPDSAVISRHIYAGVNGSPSSLLGSASFMKIDNTTWEVSSSNFPPAPTSDTLKLFRGDTLVHTQTYPRNSIFGRITGNFSDFLKVGYSWRIKEVVGPKVYYGIVYDFDWKKNMSFSPVVASKQHSISQAIDFDHLEICSESDSNMFIQQPVVADFQVSGIPIITITQAVYTYNQLLINPVSPSLCAGDAYKISWTGGDPGWFVDLAIIDVNAWTVHSYIQGNTPNDGSFVWNIPSNFPDGLYEVYIQNIQRTDWRYGNNFTITQCIDSLSIENTSPIDIAGCGGIGTLDPDSTITPASHFAVPAEFVIRGEPNADVSITFNLPPTLLCSTGGSMDVSFSSTAGKNQATSQLFDPKIPYSFNLGASGEVRLTVGMSFEADSACTCPQFNGQMIATVNYEGPSHSAVYGTLNQSQSGLSTAANLSFTCANCGNCITPPASMVAWWPLDEISGTAAIDIINNFDGTSSPGPIGPIDNANGPAPASEWFPLVSAGGAKSGSALYFWGQFSNRHISVPDYQTLRFGTSDFSLDAWVFITQYSGTEIQPIVEKMEYSGMTPVSGYRLFMESGVLTFTMAWGTGDTTVQVPFVEQISQSAWHHVAATINRGTSSAMLRLYIDGVMVKSSPLHIAGGSTIANTKELIIGGSLLGNQVNYLDVALDEVELFESELTGGQVYALFVADTLGKCKPSLTGKKFKDENHNQLQDNGEIGISNWTIFLDNLTGTNLASTVTDVQGKYSFMDVTPGVYRIREENRSGWTQTAPLSVVHQVTKVDGQIIKNLDFGNIDSCTNSLTLDTCGAGRADAYGTGDGAELSSPSVALAAVTGGVFKGFDDNTTDTYFLHTFNCWSDTCSIVGAKLTFRARVGAGGSNDAIQIRQNGSIGVWVEFLSKLPGAGGTWSNQDVTFTLDLAKLPASTISAYTNVTNILATLQDGDLDVAIQDDSEIDFMNLELELCCPCGLEMSIKNNLNGGWNLVSVPLVVPDYNVAAVYPSATGNAFSYNGGYVSTSTLDNCRGYWLKFDAPKSQTITGNELCNLSCLVNQGWNIIGSSSRPVDVSSIQTIPSGIISSAVFGYNNGYFSASTLEPGKGYWVKTNNAGKLLIGGSLMMPSASAADGSSNHSITLTINDASSSGQVLFIDKQSVTYAKNQSFEMPPLPPSGVFDARFSSQKMVEVVGGGAINEFPIMVTSAQYPVVIHWDAKEIASSAFLKIGEKRIELTRKGSVEITNPVEARNIKVIVMGQVPTDYVLHQAYPNPFNPTTTIAFGLPIDAQVTLKVYDVLGKEVAVIEENQIRQAGTYVLEFNASHLASGMYFYRLTAQSEGKTFTDVKKMMLLK